MYKVTRAAHNRDQSARSEKWFLQLRPVDSDQLKTDGNHLVYFHYFVMPKSNQLRRMVKMLENVQNYAFLTCNSTVVTRKVLWKEGLEGRTHTGISVPSKICERRCTQIQFSDLSRIVNTKLFMSKRQADKQFFPTRCPNYATRNPVPLICYFASHSHCYQVQRIIKKVLSIRIFCSILVVN